MQSPLRIALISLLAVTSLPAATIIGPVEIALWDAEDQDFGSKTTGLPFVEASDMLRSDGQAFPFAPGFLSNFAFEVDGLSPQDRAPLLEFSVTNTHPIEVLDITGIEFASQRETGTGLFLGIGYNIDGAFENEINDAIFVAPTWQIHSDGFPAFALQIIVGPGETANFVIEQVQGGNFSPVQFDSIRLTGFTAVPEPSGIALTSIAGLLLMRRRR